MSSITNKKRNFTLLIGLLMFIVWLLPYMNESMAFLYGFNTYYETIILIFLGLLVGLLLSFVKDNYYFAVFLMFIPFIFSHPFDAYSIPWGLYVATGLVVFGLIINISRFGIQLSKSYFLSGFVIFGIVTILGGLGYFADFYMLQLIFVTFSVLGMIVLYIIIYRTTKASFSDISFLLVVLGIFISLQLLVYYLLCLGNISLALIMKESYVGWGISNNISIILLLTAPFSYYFVFTEKPLKTIFAFLAFAIQFMAIIASYSRGGILASVVILLILSVYGIIKLKNKLCFLICNIMFLAIFIVFTGLAYFHYAELFKLIIEENLNADFTTLFSRMKIYDNILSKTNRNVIFGYGMFQPFFENQHGFYIWGHNTIIHTLFISGTVGVCGLLFHIAQKYYVLLKNKSVGSFIVFCAFLGSGLYGLIDVSYYFINYMIVLILIMALMEYPLRKIEEKEIA